MEKFDTSNNQEKSSKNNEVLTPPEGWMTSTALVKELSIGYGTIANIVEKYREINPEFIGEFKPRTGPLREYYAPELIKIITEKVTLFHEAPEGWKRIKEIANDLHIHKSTLFNLLSQYRQDHPEYFNNFKPKNGPPCEHYAPDLIKAISQEVGKYQQMPEGWETRGSIANRLHIKERKINNFIALHIKDHSEYLENFKDKAGNVRECLSPELVRIIEEETKKIKEIPDAPEGWKNLNTIVLELNSAYSVLRPKVNSYRESNPEYFGKYRDASGNISEHFSPELIEILNEDIKKFKQTPEPLFGWETGSALAREFDIYPKKIKDIAEKYRETNPEYFKNFRLQASITEHYAPELISLITQEIGNRKVLEVPENWESTEDIAERTGISKEEIDKMAKKLRQQHQDQFGKFRDKSDE